MKKVNFWKVYGLVATGALALVVGNSILPAEAGPEPHMMGAQNKLEGAIAQLTKAKGEFGGHRLKALEAANLALVEVKAAIAFKDEVPAPAPKPGR